MTLNKYIERNCNKGLREIDVIQMNDKHRFMIDPSGRRSRKTRNKKRMLYNIGLNPDNKDKNYYQAAPTHEQAKEIFWNDLLSFTSPIKRDVNHTDLSVRFHHNGTRIRVVGLQKPERIEGSPNDGIHIAEFPELGKIEIWDNHIFPTLTDTNGFAFIDGTPDVRYPFYKDFIYRYIGQVLESEPYKPIVYESPYYPDWVYYHWQSIDVLGEKTINEIKEQVDTLSFQQEYEGKFIQGAGVVYYAFSEDNLKPIEFNPGLPTIVCYDFNVNPMTIIINQEIGANSNGDFEYCAVKEFNLSDSNTIYATKALINYLDENNFSGTLEATGDYSGIARDTTAGQGAYSDWMIIDDMLKNYRGYVKRISRVGNVIDRVNALNGLFANTVGIRKQFINKAACPYLHKDITRQVWKDDGRLNDENGKVGHKSDALSYFAYNYYRIGREL